MAETILPPVVSMEGVPVITATDPLDLGSVVDQLEPMIRERAEKGPVVVMTGEMHHVSTHVALPQAIMARFTDGPSPLKVAHGIEWPHNLYQEIMESEFGRSLSPELRNAIESAGNDDQKLLRAFRETINPPGVPMTRRNVLEFVYSRNISMRPTDAARKPGWNGTDFNEQMTRKLAEKHAPQYFGLDPKSPEAQTQEIRLRNIMAVDIVEQHIRDSGAQVYVLPYGGAHLLGMRPEVEGLSHPYQDSLHALFAERGIDSIPVFITAERGPQWNGNRFSGLHIIPVAADQGLRRGVVVKGLGEATYHNEISDIPEMRFLEEVRRRSHGAFEVFPDPGIKAAFPHWTFVKPQSDTTNQQPQQQQQSQGAEPREARAENSYLAPDAEISADSIKSKIDDLAMRTSMDKRQDFFRQEIGNILAKGSGNTRPLSLYDLTQEHTNYRGYGYFLIRSEHDIAHAVMGLVYHEGIKAGVFDKDCPDFQTGRYTEVMPFDLDSMIAPSSKELKRNNYDDSEIISRKRYSDFYDKYPEKKLSPFRPDINKVIGSVLSEESYIRSMSWLIGRHIGERAANIRYTHGYEEERLIPQLVELGEKLGYKSSYALDGGYGSVSSFSTNIAEWSIETPDGERYFSHPEKGLKLPQGSNGVEEFQASHFPDQEMIGKIYRVLPLIAARIKEACADKTVNEGFASIPVSDVVSIIRDNIHDNKPKYILDASPEQQQQLRAPTPVQPAPDAPIEPSMRTAPVTAGATETIHSVNGKVGAASIAINLADAAIKGDGTKAAEVGGTAVALEGGMKVVAKVAGVRAVPVAGQIVGAGFAGVDAYEAATSGNTTRAIVSGTEATLYTVAAGAGTAAAFNFWNPVGWGAGTVAVAAGATAVTITAAKAVYDNWNTVTGWFGYHAPSSAPDQSPHPQVTEAATPPITNKTRGSGRGSLRLTTADQTSPPQEASAAMPLSPKRQAVTSITPAPA